jgi:L-ascorbate peroxidase
MSFDPQIFKQVVAKIKETIQENPRRIPEYVRLAFHDQGTYHKELNKGGGGTVQFMLPGDDNPTGLPHNGGLAEPINILKATIAGFEGVSLADTIQLAGATAIKVAGGPSIPIKWGRTDHPQETAQEIIDFYKGKYGNNAMSFILPKPNHVKELETFYVDKFGFDVVKVVVMNGAHTLGGVKRDVFKYTGTDKPNPDFLTWTATPFQFNNEYYKNVRDLGWESTFRESDGELKSLIWVDSLKEETPKKDKELILLETDFVQRLNIRNVEEEIAGKWKETVNLFANDQDEFFRQFAEVFKQISEFGWEDKLQDLIEVEE